MYMYIYVCIHVLYIYIYVCIRWTLCVNLCVPGRKHHQWRGLLQRDQALGPALSLHIFFRHTYVYIYIYMYACMYIDTHIHIYMSMYTHVCEFFSLFLSPTHVYFRHIITRIHIYIYTYTCKHTCIYFYTCVHICIHHIYAGICNLSCVCVYLYSMSNAKGSALADLG